MSQNPEPPSPVVDSILHPSDFSAGSVVAFHHALKSALVARSKLTVLHVSPGAAPDWTDFPGVRETLERWGLIAPGSPKSAVPALGIEVRKAVAQGSSPVSSVLRYLESHPADLIVLATHAHEGRASWLRQSVSEPLARKSGQMTLFLPSGTPGFVSAADGAVTLERILIPIAASPRPQPALAAAVQMVKRLERPSGTFTLLHVGEASTMPAVQCPEVPGWQWTTVHRTGDVIHGIVDTAAKDRSDLIVMSTDGRNGFLDALRGSHSERVLRSASCPVLTLPEGSLAAGAVE
ncbi:MAG: universal stress protein [Verrucomicrobia bacterium]|nr:universal stress protein [Verrucomicrobiota bacterium]